MSLISKAVYVFILISVTQEEYFVSKEPSKWSKENEEKCRFAKPPLTFAQDKVTTKLGGFDTSFDNVWVGYFRQSTALEYIGCVAKNDIANTVALTAFSKDPGYCFTICKHSENSRIIGIFNTTCFCLSDDFIREKNVKRLFCTLKCTSGTDVACGGVHGKENFVSLYRLNHNVKDNLNQKVPGSCLILDKNQNTFNWINCSSNGYRVLCADDHNEEYVYYKTWIEATVICLNKDMFPANYSASMKAVLEPTSVFWTGIIRSHVLYEFDVEVPSQTGFEYGYLIKSDSDYELKFQKQDEKIHYLCVKEDASTAKTTVQSSTELPKSQTPSSSVSVFKTTVITSHTDRGIEDLNATVPVVVSVSVVLVVAISVAAFVILRKRGKIPDICGNTNSTKSSAHPIKYESSVKKTPEDNQYEQVDDIISNSKNEKHRDVQTCDANYEHTYFVLEKVENQQDKVDATEKHATEMAGSNFYNTLEQDVEKKIKQSKTKDRIYDTTETVAEKLRCEFGEDSYALGNKGENLYNHTNSVPMKNNKTENVYNVTGDKENAYGDTGTNHDNKAFVDDDTYHHIKT